MNERDVNLRRRYVLQETQEFVNGRDFSLSVVRRGLVVNDNIFISYLGGASKGIFSVGFATIADGQRYVPESSLSRENLRTFRRYEYRDLVKGKRALIRIGTRYLDSARKVVVDFTLSGKVERADKLGVVINLERGSKD